MKSIINSIPLFVLGFITLIFFRTMIDTFYMNSEIWGSIFNVSEKVTTILFGLALTALGASINLKKIFNQGYTPVLIGMVFSLVTFFSVCILIFILGLNI